MDMLVAVVLDGASGPQTVFVEIVRKQQEIRRGLMFREHMPQDQGMLFLMGHEKVHTFYMRNTLIPLDIIFITRDKTVAGVVENAVPLDETSRDVGKPSLEIGGSIQARANDLGVDRFHVSLSHDAGVASAVVIAEG